MAEIRKHQPTLRDEIDAAILAALGEDVRYVPPGSRPEPISTPSAAADKPTPIDPIAPTLGVATQGWLSLDPHAVAKPLSSSPAPSLLDEDDEDETEA